MLLWFLFALLTVTSFVFVLRPLTKQKGLQTKRSDFDVAVYKDQLNEVDLDYERGLISEQEAKTAKTEISRRLLQSSEQPTEGQPENPERTSNTNILALVISFVCIPIMSLGIYLLLGSPNVPDHPLSARINNPVDQQSIRTLVARVERRLQVNPSDGKGWDVLAPVYLKLQRFEDAANAYRRAAQLLGTNAERLTGYGEAIVRANNEVVTEDAKQAFKQALSLNDSLVLPRVRLIFALEQEGKKEEALKSWQEVDKLAAGNPALRQLANQRIAILKGQSNDTKPIQGKPKQQTAELKGPSAEDIKAANQMSAGDRSEMIKNMVSGLAERLRENGGSLQEWIRLIRAYNVLGKKDMAKKALGDAQKNLKEDVKALSQLQQFAKELGLVS